MAGPVLVSRFRDDADFEELLVDFVSAMGQRASGLVDAMANGQLDEVRRQAHQLKGAAGGYGFDEVSQVAADLEHACRAESPNPTDVSEKLERVLDYLCRVSV